MKFDKKGQISENIQYIIIAVVVVAVAAAGIYLTMGDSDEEGEGPTDDELQGTLTVWEVQDEGPEAKAMKAMFEAFAEEHPGVDLDLQLNMSDEEFKTKLPTALAGGTPPDVFHSWGGGSLVSYAKDDLVADLTDLLESEPLNQYVDPGMMSYVSYEDNYYAAPFQAWATGFYVNTEIFEEAGLEPPEMGYQPTWEEFTNWIETIRSETNYTPVSMPADTGVMWVPHFWYMALVDRLAEPYAFEKTLNREEGYSFTDAPFVEAARKLMDLKEMNAYHEGFMSDDHTAGTSLYKNGDAAMYFDGDWFAPEIEEEAPETFQNTVAIWFPSLPDGTGEQKEIVGGPNTFLSVAKKGNTEIGKAFLEWIYTSDKYLENWLNSAGTMSAVKGTNRDPDNINKLNQQTTEKYNEASYTHNAWDQYSPRKWATTLLDGLRLLLAGEQSPEEFAQSLEDQAQTLDEEGDLPVPYYPPPAME